MINYSSKSIFIFMITICILHHINSTCIEGSMYDEYVTNSKRMLEYINSNVKFASQLDISTLLGTRVKLLGSGGFGNVFLYRSGSSDYAVKTMKINRNRDQFNEIKFLFFELNANNCVKKKVAEMPKMKGQFVTFNQVFKCTDTGTIYMTMKKYSGNLFDNIYNTNTRGYVGLSVGNKLDIIHKMIQLTRSMIVLEKSSYVHRDLKPENILLDSNSRVYIGDLGLLITKPQFNDVSGTPNFVDPNMILTKQGSVKSDVYSLGVIFYLMLESYNQMKNVEKSTNTQIAICKQNKNLCSANVLNFPNRFQFMNSMTNLNPLKRPTLDFIFQELSNAHEQLVNPQKVTNVQPMQQVPVQMNPTNQSKRVYKIIEKPVDHQVIPISEKKDNKFLQNYIGHVQQKNNQNIANKVVIVKKEPYQALRGQQNVQVINRSIKPSYKIRKAQPSVEILQNMQMQNKNKIVQNDQNYLNSNAMLRNYYKARNYQDNFQFGRILLI